MKRIIKIVLSLTLSFVFLIPSVAYAGEGETAQAIRAEWVEENFTQEEIDQILSQNPNNQIQPLATGLIATGSLGISKDGTKLKIVAQTACSPVVVKSGFKEIVVQKRKNSSYSWSNVVVYEDLYDDRPSCTVSTTITVQTGYQYRATCIHYAKKNIFSTQTLNNTSNIVTVS